MSIDCYIFCFKTRTNEIENSPVEIGVSVKDRDNKVEVQVVEVVVPYNSGLASSGE